MTYNKDNSIPFLSDQDIATLRRYWSNDLCLIGDSPKTLKKMQEEKEKILGELAPHNKDWVGDDDEKSELSNILETYKAQLEMEISKEHKIYLTTEEEVRLRTLAKEPEFKNILVEEKIIESEEDEYNFSLLNEKPNSLEKMLKEQTALESYLSLADKFNINAGRKATIEKYACHLQEKIEKSADYKAGGIQLD